MRFPVIDSGNFFSIFNVVGWVERLGKQLQSIRLPIFQGITNLIPKLHEFSSKIVDSPQKNWNLKNRNEKCWHFISKKLISSNEISWIYMVWMQTVFCSYAVELKWKTGNSANGIFKLKAQFAWIFRVGSRVEYFCVKITYCSFAFCYFE